MSREHPTQQIAWAWYNYGTLLGTEYRKRDAICACENHTGEPWKRCKTYMEVHKVIVKPVNYREPNRS